MTRKVVALATAALGATGLLPAAALADPDGRKPPPRPPAVHLVRDCRGTLTLVQVGDRIVHTAPGDPTCPDGTGTDFQHNETLVADSI